MTEQLTIDNSEDRLPPLTVDRGIDFRVKNLWVKLKVITPSRGDTLSLSPDCTGWCCLSECKIVFAIYHAFITFSQKSFLGLEFAFCYSTVLYRLLPDTGCYRLSRLSGRLLPDTDTGCYRLSRPAVTTPSEAFFSESKVWTIWTIKVLF
jgi:hypothetical protein